MMVMQNIEIKEESDIVVSRRMVREIAQDMGFGIVDQTKLATATSELARNIYRYAQAGTVCVKKATDPDGIRILFEDNGPGIEDTDLAMEEGFSTTPGSLGLGLIGAKRLVDDMTIDSVVGVGTTVTIFKHLP
jgi:serine/threonine-protein kinase RsbT